MASLNELINLAQFQEAMAQQADPLTTISNLVSTLASNYIERKQREAKFNKLKEIISKGEKYKTKYTIDENGNLKLSIEPKEDKKKISLEKALDLSIKLAKTEKENPTMRDIQKYYNILTRTGGTEGEEVSLDVLGLKEGPKSWGETSLFSRVLGALTPWPTALEQKLGKIRPGGIFFPPKSESLISEQPSIKEEITPIDTSKIQIPSEMKSLREIIDYLMEKYNLSIDDAMEVIKQKGLL